MAKKGKKSTNIDILKQKKPQNVKLLWFFHWN